MGEVVFSTHLQYRRPRIDCNAVCSPKVNAFTVQPSIIAHIFGEKTPTEMPMNNECVSRRSAARRRLPNIDGTCKGDLWICDFRAPLRTPLFLVAFKA